MFHYQFSDNSSTFVRFIDYYVFVFFELFKCFLSPLGRLCFGSGVFQFSGFLPHLLFHLILDSFGLVVQN